jgi:Family of unknown function (DUF5681)
MEKQEMNARKPIKEVGQSNQNSDVGYGSPPKNTRFKAGVSGNPKGRPKWQQDKILTRVLGQELYRSVRVQQNGGGTVSMPALQVGLRRLMASAAKGDPASVSASIKLAQFLGQAVAEEQSKYPPMSQEERDNRVVQLFERVRLRMERKKAAEQAKANEKKKPGKNHGV